MLPIKIKDGVASIAINMSRKLTKQQIATIERTADYRGQRAADTYLESLLGLHKRRVDVSRHRDVGFHRADRLALKEPGSVARMFKNLLNNDEDMMHRPSEKSPGHWIGVEIECFYPASKDCTDDCDHDNGDCYADYEPSESEAHNKIRSALEKAGVARCSVKSDGSLDSEDGVAVEVTLLFNSVHGYSQLEKLCAVLTTLGCFVNKTCGLHVHLDARHLNKNRARLLGRRLGRALPVLKYIVDPSRHDNHYCKMDVGPLDRDHDNRYYAVNMQAFFRYKTIEVRMHGGSINHNKIRNWIELLRFIAASRMPKELTTFQSLIDLGLPAHLVEYADKRISKLNPSAWPRLMTETPERPKELYVIGTLHSMNALGQRQWFKATNAGMTFNFNEAFLFTFDSAFDALNSNENRGLYKIYSLEEAALINA